MIIVIVPMVILLTVILVKGIPKIGGNIYIALFLAGIVSLLMGGVYNPLEWGRALIDGLDRIAWVMMLSLFGSLYSEAQVELGTVDTIMSALEARFKNNPRMLVICVVLVLVLAGSLLGDAIAAATVVGVLTISTLAVLGLSGEVICSIIVMGAAMGSIMPPMSQALALSSALVGTDPDPVFRMGYLTVSIVVVLVCIYIVFFLLRKVKKIEFESDKTSLQILRENWFTMIPLFALIIVVFFRTIQGPLRFDLMTTVLASIPIGGSSLLDMLKQIPVIKGITNGIVLCIIFALMVSFLFPRVHKKSGRVFKLGIRNVRYTLLIQLCAGFMLGSFYAAGQIEAVKSFALGLDNHVIIIGGTSAMALIGMLTGSQTTAQNVVFSFFGPTLVDIGISPTYAATAGASMAMAGQGMPPADLTTFVTAGIVGGVLGTKVDPVKSMIIALPMCLFFTAEALIILYM